VNRLDQQAFFRFSWNKGRTGIASAAKCGRGVYGETTLELVRGRIMALVTMLDKHGPNLLFEKLPLGVGDFQRL